MVHIIWFHITPMVSDLLIGLCAIMMVISVALHIIQNNRTLKGDCISNFILQMTRKYLENIDEIKKDKT